MFHLDDVTRQDHLFHVEWALEELRRAGLTKNLQKCHLGLTKAHYLGYGIGQELLKPQEKKVEAVRHYPQPETKKQVQAFLGLASYYLYFLPNFASLAAQPLRPHQERRTGAHKVDHTGNCGIPAPEGGPLQLSSVAEP